MVREVKEKIADFSDVFIKEVISVHDVSSVYQVPLILQEQNVIDILFQKLNLRKSAIMDLSRWRYLCNMIEEVISNVTIGLIGKYTKNSDAYASVIKALQHSALWCRRKLIINYIEASHLEKSTKDICSDKHKKAWDLLLQSK